MIIVNIGLLLLAILGNAFTYSLTSFPTFIPVFLAIISLTLFLIQLIATRENATSILFSMLLYVTWYLCLKIHALQLTRDGALEPIILTRVFQGMFIFFSVAITVIYYRLLYGFKTRRGNLSKDEILVQEDNLKSSIEKLKKRLKRKKLEPDSIENYYFSLGEKVERRQ